MQTCAIEGCELAVRSRGWCNKHYLRWYFKGDPEAIKNNRGKTTEERFWEKVNKDLGECWYWTGTVTPKGYGLFHDGKMVSAHRWAYQHLVGLIPEGLQLDHLCRAPACVNPAHLEIVTNRENVIRGVTARGIDTHCKYGHPRTPENLYLHGGRRFCRVCQRERTRKGGRPR